ncbi:MAG: hypothetical protein HYV07_22750 [Deltaproteobacteria bacterium]|nr:hypothetical protein [Deltaproteobacteria bacterium]
MPPIHRGLILGLALALLACEDDEHTPEGVAKNTALTPATHTELFPIAVGDHATPDCQLCHGDFDTFSEFTCFKCHDHDRPETDSIHTGVSGYAYDSNACYRCHPDGEGTLDRASHDRYFPIVAPALHAPVDCAGCHPQGTDPANREVVNCLGCHHDEATTRSAHPILDYRYTSASCAECHADSQVDQIRSHLPVVISGGDHRASRIGCLGCHTQNRSDKRWAADFGSFVCYDCHQDDAGEHDEEGVSYPTPPGGCIAARCHPDGQKD